LVVADSILGHAIGVAMFESTNNWNNANMTYYSYVTDANHDLVLTSQDYLAFKTDSCWAETGHITIYSNWDLHNILTFNATGVFDYGDHKYSFTASENDYTYPGHDSVFVYGYGQYGGSWSKWYTTLDQSYLYYNDGLVGTAQGDIIGVTPDSWLNGRVNYQSNAKDSNYNKVFSTVGSTIWQSDDWSERGYFRTQSVVDVKNVINWNASALASYGDNAYKLDIEETGTTTQYDDDYFSHVVSYVPSKFVTMIQGEYGWKGFNEG
jgi:hypothetical protein